MYASGLQSRGSAPEGIALAAKPAVQCRLSLRTAAAARDPESLGHCVNVVSQARSRAPRAVCSELVDSFDVGSVHLFAGARVLGVVAPVGAVAGRELNPGNVGMRLPHDPIIALDRGIW